MHSLFADDNAFHGWQKSKQQKKCKYLDERNIVLSSYVTVKSCFYGSGENEGEKSFPRCSTSQNNAPTNKCPVALPARPNNLSQYTSDMEHFPVNSMSTHAMTQKENITYSPSPSTLELKQRKPLVQCLPATCEQASKESLVPWRCKGFAPMNRESKPTEPLQLSKWPAAQKLGWCHKSLARWAHVEVHSPKNALPAFRCRPVIQKPVVDHKGVQVHNQKVEKSFCWISASKSLLIEGGTRPPMPVDLCNQTMYRPFWNAVPTEEWSKELEQQEDDHMLHRNNVSWVSVSSYFLQFTPNNHIIALL